MEKSKTKTQQVYHDRGMHANINDSIYALASHLCAYTDLLRQISAQNTGRPKTQDSAYTYR